MMNTMLPQSTETTFEAYVQIVRLSQRLEAEANLLACLRAPRIDNATAQTAVETVRPMRGAR